MFFQRPRPGFSALTVARIASRSDSGQPLPGGAELGLADLVALGLGLVAGLRCSRTDRRESAFRRWASSASRLGPRPEPDNPTGAW